MLVVKPRTEGAGIFDVFSKVANSALTKTINSTIGKKIVEKATKDNFIKAANSAIGKQLQTAVVKGVADASEKAADLVLKKLGAPIKPGIVKKVTEKAAESALEKLGIEKETSADSTFQKLGIKRKTADSVLGKKKRKLSSTPGISKKRKRIGAGIILE